MSTWASAASVCCTHTLNPKRQADKSCLLELRQAYSAVAAVSHDAPQSSCVAKRNSNSNGNGVIVM